MMTATTTNSMIWRLWRSSFQKWTAVAAVLDFTVEEWESLNRLMEANAAEMSEFAAVGRDRDHVTRVQCINASVCHQPLPRAR